MEHRAIIETILIYNQINPVLIYVEVSSPFQTLSRELGIEDLEIVYYGEYC